MKGQEDRKTQEIKKLAEKNEFLENQIKHLNKKIASKPSMLQKIPDLESDEEMELQKEELLDELRKSMKESGDI